MKKQQNRSPKALRPGARVAAPAKDSFQNFQARLGYGTGNVSDGGSYGVNYLSRNRFQLEAMYRSSWICGKAVDTVAEDMTKRGIEINSELDPGGESELMALWKSLQLWDCIADTIKWARLYGGAIAVLLIDGQKFDTPLRVESVGRGQFKGLLALDRWMVQPDLTDLVSTLGPDLGKPEFYTVTGGAGMALKGSTRIHYSRVIRMEGQDLPYFQRIAEMLWGQSVLERLYDRLLAFDSTTQGAAQLVYKAHLRTYKVEGLRDIIAAGGPALEGLVKQIDFIRSTQTNEGLTLMDTNDEFEAHAYQFGGLDTVLLQFAQQLSGALNIPLTRLFGQSPAGLNATGESDLRTYYDGIEQEQERRLRTGIDMLLKVSHLSQFGKPLPEGTTFTFRPLWQLTDAEKATIAGQICTAVTQAQNGGTIGRQTALKELKQSSKITGVFSNISDETIEAADDDVDTGEFGERDPFGDEDGDKSKSKTKDEDWNESDHPRKDDGEFAPAGAPSSSSGTESSVEHPLGPLFHEFAGKPHEAIAKLRSEKRGALPDVWDNPDVPKGKIGLSWGVPGDPANKWRGGSGLSHIIAKHVEAQKDFKLEDLPDLVPKLQFVRVERENRLIMETPDHRAVVSLDWHGKDEHWIISAYEPKKD